MKKNDGESQMIPVLEKIVAAPGCPFFLNNGIIAKKRPPRNRKNASFHGLCMDEKRVKKKYFFRDAGTDS